MYSTRFFRPEALTRRTLLTQAPGIELPKAPPQARGDTLSPRPNRAKPTGFVVVQLAERALNAEADAADSLPDVLKLAKMDALAGVLKALGLEKARRLITSVPSKRLREMEERAERSALPPLRSLRGYWLLDLRHQSDATDDVVRRLLAVPGVANAYAHQAGDDPANNPGNDPYNGTQGYQDAAPDGIDSRWAWTQPSGFG